MEQLHVNKLLLMLSVVKDSNVFDVNDVIFSKLNILDYYNVLKVDCETVSCLTLIALDR